MALSRWLILTAAILAVPVSTRATTILGSVILANDGLVLGQGVLPPQLPLLFAVSVDTPNPCFAVSPTCLAVVDQTLTAADIGTTLVFDKSSPGFASVASFLTDGIGDEFEFALSANAGGGFGDSLSNLFPNLNRPDFAGDVISEIDLTVNNLSFQQVQLPISNVPVIFGTFTEANPDLTITVQGSQAPEPSSALPVAAALLMAVFSRRRWTKS